MGRGRTQSDPWQCSKLYQSQLCLLPRAVGMESGKPWQRCSKEMGLASLVTQLPNLLPSRLCGCCCSTSSLCSCTRSFFLAPASSPTAGFQPVESAVPQFQRRENVNNLFTSPAYFCNTFWQVSLCCVGLSLTLLLVTFLKHILPKTFTVADRKLKHPRIFFFGVGRGAGLGLHCGRWALVAMGQLTQVPCIGTWILNHWTRKSLKCLRLLCITLHHLAPLPLFFSPFSSGKEYI